MDCIIYNYTSKLPNNGAPRKKKPHLSSQQHKIAKSDFLQICKWAIQSDKNKSRVETKQQCTMQVNKMDAEGSHTHFWRNVHAHRMHGCYQSTKQ